jgi:hypothetical protein
MQPVAAAARGLCGSSLSDDNPIITAPSAAAYVHVYASVDMLSLLTASLLYYCCCCPLQGTMSKSKLQQVETLQAKLKYATLNTELSESALVYEQDTSTVLSNKLAKALQARKTAEDKARQLQKALKKKTDFIAQQELLLKQRGVQVAFYLHLLRFEVPFALDKVSAPAHAGSVLGQTAFPLSLNLASSS